MIRSLAAGSSTGTVQRVELLGAGPVKFMQDANGLAVTLPPQKPCDYVYGLKIQGYGIV